MSCSNTLVALVSLSPDSPTQMFRHNFEMRSSRILLFAFVFDVDIFSFLYPKGENLLSLLLSNNSYILHFSRFCCHLNLHCPLGTLLKVIELKKKTLTFLLLRWSKWLIQVSKTVKLKYNKYRLNYVKQLFCVFTLH